MAQTDDPRRHIPRTDALLADERIALADKRFGRARVRAAITAAQDRARRGEISAAQVTDAVIDALPTYASSLRPVLNGTGVIVHTNLGRAPLSAAAREAIVAAAGATDVELDLDTGLRGPRGRAVIDALLARVPDAQDALVVNNGAAALLLATTALSAGREVVVSRGELVEIGDGFRLPDLMASGGARMREVGTTNRTHRQDYANAITADTGVILKVHPSNFAVSGFTAAVPVEQLADLGPPVVHDIGSGLLEPHPALAGEPDAATSLRAGASLVTCSGDKLLGGPQAGLILGRADVIHQLRRHPMARALRVDKTTLAALEATMLGPTPPVLAQLDLAQDTLHQRCAALVTKLPTDCDAHVIASHGRVGGGGAPEVVLDSAAIALPAAYAAALRQGEPALLARVERGQCLVDLRCIDPDDEPLVLEAIVGAHRAATTTD